MLLVALFGLSLHAQLITAPPTTPPSFDPRPAIQNMIHAQNESAPDHTRFTYHKRQRVITQRPNGRIEYDKTSLFEVTWINDHPYWRLIAVNDHTLDDKAKQDEQKRFDKAMAKKKDLGEKQRVALDDGQMDKMDADPAMLLTPLYTFTEKASQTIPSGATEHLIEATLAPGAKPKSHCKYRFQLWITEPDNMVRKYIADVPDSKDFICANSKDVGTFTIVDGVLKPAHWSSRFFPDELQGDASINDDSYTDYQWFSTDGETSKEAKVHLSSAPANLPQPENTPAPR